MVSAEIKLVHDRRGGDYHHWEAEPRGKLRIQSVLEPSTLTWIFTQANRFCHGLAERKKNDVQDHVNHWIKHTAPLRSKTRLQGETVIRNEENRSRRSGACG
jgi:hypothetical protein